MDKILSPNESMLLLNEMGVILSSKNLVYYSQEGGMTEVKHLINAGVDVNSTHNGTNSLIKASSEGHSDIVKLLLDNNAKVNVLDNSKLDALYYAVKGGHVEVSKILLENGASPDGTEGRALPPIGAAIEIENKQLIQLLVDYKVDLNMKSDDGYSLSYSVFHHSSQEMYNFIVSLGAPALTDEEKKKSSRLSKWGVFLKSVYAKNAYLFLSVNLFSIIIFFFVLDEKTGGSFFERVYIFLFCTLLGAFIGVKVARLAGSSENIIKGFRRGVGSVLMTGALLLWSNNGYVSSSRSYNSSSSSSENHSCGECGRNFNGNGWSTVGGEQFQQSSWSGYGYCSKSCAYESQPKRWK